MKVSSFSDLNELFAAKCADPSHFEVGAFNLIKVIQHALIYAHNEVDQYLLSNHFDKPTWIHQGYYRARSLGKSTQPLPTFRQRVILEPGRHRMDQDGNPVSHYFSLIPNAFSPEEVTTLLDRKSEVKTFDYFLPDLMQAIDKRGLDKTLNHYLVALHQLYDRLKRSQSFSKYELKHISSAMHVFFEDLRKYYWLFKEQPTRQVIFATHYHKEGLLAALKLLNIEAVEIQHGLISRNDVYYMYADFVEPVAERALFADRIAVLGNYWKQLLLEGAEYRNASIGVVGDYTFTLGKFAPEHVDPAAKEDLIVVAAQKNMADEYLEYLHQLLPLLLEKHPAWKVILKLHPTVVAGEDYSSLEQYSNVEVVRTEADLFDLFSRARIHISIYSTTFFDALGYQILNFSLQDYSVYRDYAREMIREGVAHPLAFDADPVARFEQLIQQDGAYPDREEVYGTWNAAQFKTWIDGESN